MAALTIQDIVRAGLDPTYETAAGGGDTAANLNGDVHIHIKNGSGGSVTATFETPRTVDGLAVDDLAVPIPAGEERFIGPFPPSTFNDGAGDVAITYSAVTSVTIAALRI